MRLLGFITFDCLSPSTKEAEMPCFFGGLAEILIDFSFIALGII